MKRFVIILAVVAGMAASGWGDDVGMFDFTGQWNASTGEIWKFNPLSRSIGDVSIIGMGYTHLADVTIQTNDGKTYLQLQWDNQTFVEDISSGTLMDIYEVRLINLTNLTLTPFMRIRYRAGDLMIYFQHDALVNLTRRE